MIFTDTHTHIYYERDTESRRQLVDRCREKGVSRLFLPNVNSESISLVKDITEEFPDMCFPMLGLHPCDVKEDYRQELDSIYSQLDTMQIYAIGEIGIDLYWEKDTLPSQQKAFREQIHWAKERGLPIVIHCREAFDEVYEILLSEADDKLRGIFHCFTGTLQQAQKVIELGFYLGIGGVLTYKNSGLDKVISEIDMKHIVLETDSPYLAPVPFRGKPNESSYLVYIAQKLADIKQISLEEAASITTENSKKIFEI